MEVEVRVTRWPDSHDRDGLLRGELCVVPGLGNWVVFKKLQNVILELKKRSFDRVPTADPGTTF